MTLDEFEKRYAEFSNLTVKQLRAFGLQGIPCDCNENGCNGWQMIHKILVDVKNKDKEIISHD